MLGKKSDEYEGRLDDSFELNFNIDKDFVKFVFLFLIILFFFSYFNNFFGIFDKGTCGDGTLYGMCSDTLPYFCLKGTLVQDASFCGCPENISVQGDSCVYDYQTSPKTVGLDYILNGEYGKIDFVVYKGMVSYLEKRPQTSFYSNTENYSLYDFKKRVVEEPEQKKFLMPLVIEIQNIAKSKEDQARIAISLVQNIPYEGDAVFDPKNPFLWNLKYPYDVLYQREGLCGSKSDLLSFLLKEIGYDVVIFHYYSENHEAVGIKCPVRYSLNNTGYCFVETTQPAIISYSEGEYSERGQLFSSPEIISISGGEGLSLGENLEEYGDAKDFGRIYKSSEKSEGRINILEYYRYNQLMEKYGLQK